MRFDDPNWWRHAVTYQIYPRSFADSNNDATGDIRGIIDKLDHLASLGVDAIWVSPWYPSPLWDGGYDVSDYGDINPDFGTLAEADEFIAKAHELGLRVLIDLVPNHCSIDHPLFQKALAAGPGSPERDWFIFRDGKGPQGDEPPTNWGGMFGGPGWERVTEADGRPGQWYLHMFAPEQPDWNWDNEQVRAEIDRVLRFWFDRGVDGFRVDVADSLVKDPSFKDMPIDPLTGHGSLQKVAGSPLWDQPGLAEVQRRWRRLADSYAGTELGARIFVSEAYLPLEQLVEYVRPDRLHTSFNFEFLQSEWTPTSMRTVIDASITGHDAVGAPTTWVLENHDVIRVPSRYGKPVSGRPFTGADQEEDGHWQERLAGQPTDLELGRRRARAAAALMLALPGGAYVYQGQELGLEEVEDLPDEALQDPTWVRSNHTVRGRDGCRVPLPWGGDQPPFGFGTDAEPWLPQPEGWGELSVEAQDGDPSSTLNLFRTLLRLRHELEALGDGAMAWDQSAPEVLSFTREPGFRCVVNFGATPVELDGELLVSTVELVDGKLPVDAAAWLRV
ncbi:alpha-amylase family glycosyl hydrolase [Luteococcus peritonei]|uniref:Alpha-amylase family glycosyl hydrolase n=1 Tax=Luteococcus peritonei TaxID=88874 RepID=A0ABW4RW35_9ACTN